MVSTNDVVSWVGDDVTIPFAVLCVFPLGKDLTICDIHLIVQQLVFKCQLLVWPQVTMYGLFVEHTLSDMTLWEGKEGWWAVFLFDPI